MLNIAPGVNERLRQRRKVVKATQEGNWQQNRCLRQDSILLATTLCSLGWCTMKHVCLLMYEADGVRLVAEPCAKASQHFLTGTSSGSWASVCTFSEQSGAVSTDLCSQAQSLGGSDMAAGSGIHTYCEGFFVIETFISAEDAYLLQQTTIWDRFPPSVSNFETPFRSIHHTTVLGNLVWKWQMCDIQEAARCGTSHQEWMHSKPSNAVSCCISFSRWRRNWCSNMGRHVLLHQQTFDKSLSCHHPLLT